MFPSFNTGTGTDWRATAPCLVIAMAFLAITLFASATPVSAATQVNLSANYNRAGFYTDGVGFTTGGFDATSTAMSATLLGTSLGWNNLVFDLGPSNTLDVVSCTNQIITLPPGQFNTLQILAAAINGGQQSQTFTVTYTDNSTNTFTQSISDWANPQSYPGEFTALTMPYRNGSGGTRNILNVSVHGYVLVLDQTKTVESITLPNDSNVNLMAMVLADDGAPVPLSSYYNRAGIYRNGTAFPVTAGLDDGGDAYSATLTGNSLTWDSGLFAFGPFNATNVISCTGQTITLPPGNYALGQILATAVNGAQTSQSFTITYANSTTTTFLQSFSDWASPMNFSGESKALAMSYRNTSGGTTNTVANYLYGYSFKLNPAKIVQSVRLPNDSNVIVTAISLISEYEPIPPTFGVNPLVLPGADAGQAYSANIATNATDLKGDPMTFALVSGPSWLAVASNGALSGTPANTNAGTNTFLVTATDTEGLSSTDRVYITVNGVPYFNLNPFTLPSAVVGRNYSGTIATNATDPNMGDVPVFSIVSGPSWLSVDPNGTLYGKPALANVGTNTFTVSVTGYQASLTSTGTMYILVEGPILPQILRQSGALKLIWSGGVAPYQLQMTTNLSNPNWQDLGGPISGTNALITPSNSAAFYRIVGQ